MDTQNKPILVTGATGQQGGAVARHLLADGWPVHALTRNPDKPEAQALAELGAEVVQGDLDNASSVEAALDGTYGVFSVQTFIEEGTETERRQGNALADAAQAAGIEHFVYSSVGGAERNTGIPHFESKWAIEEHIRAIGLPATILRPVFFMENLLTFNRPTREDGALTFSMALPPNRPLAMIAVDDIGAFAALAFSRPDEFKGETLEIAGDEIPGTRVAELWSNATSEPVRYVEQPLDELRSFSEELAVMYEWFDEEGYDPDIPALQKLHPGLKTFEAWLGEHDARELIP